MLIFSTHAYNYLKQEVLTLMPNAQEGIISVKTFPDTERYHRFEQDLQQHHVVIIGGTTSDADTLELYDLAVGAAQNGAKALSLVIPYFGYSTMERRVYNGEVVKAQSRALLFSSIPAVESNLSIYLFDLHSEGIPYYFDRHIRTHHVYCKPVILKAARDLGGSDFVLASTDAGRAKWVESLAIELNVPSAFAYKTRKDGSTTQLSGINAEVDNKHVIIYDDMIRTGGSLLQCAEIYKQMGATQIDVLCTHGIFCDNALSKIKASGLIRAIVCTNSHSNSQNIKDITVYSIAPLIANELN